ncbi:MFS transporter [Mycobacterium sp. 3519A]|uniref:MFS transporter n=1 Tax=Mycobacterium sp. 3519A TaxID=2057184 RepID=UPI001159D13D|nr:MFS transporter [Mycobacterium sp. 3519A]
MIPHWPGMRVLAGSMLFNLASGCFTITLGQALFERSGSVSAFTGVVVIEYLVPVLLGALAGSVADRVNPAVVCAVASIVPGLALMGYLVAPAGLMVMGIAVGLIVNLIRPFYRAGIFAVGPRSLHQTDLPRYNMRWTVSVQAGQITGGAVAGAFLWATGPKWAFFAAATAYALAAYALASARSAVSPLHEDDDAAKDTWISVLRDALNSPWSVLSLLLLGVDFLTIAAFNVALAPLVHELYGNESWLGILDVCFAVGAIAAPAVWGRYSSRVSSRGSVTAGFATQILGFTTIAIGLGFGGTPGQSAVPVGAVLLGLGVAVSSSEQVSILQVGAKSSTLGRIGALRQAVIGLTTALTLPVVGHLVDKDLAAACGAVVVVLTLGLGVNIGVARRERVAVA